MPQGADFGRPAKPDAGPQASRDDRRPGSLGPRGVMLRLMALTVVIGCVVLIAGLVAFILDIVQSRSPNRATGEGIVVLTGGRDRIDVALDVLAEGSAKRLLISGVNPATTADAIRRQTGGTAQLFSCCVDLGRRAETTIGNAYETADWVAAHGFKSIVIVTSAYHVPRALVEMRAAFARRGLHVRIQAIGVRKASLSGAALAFEGETLRLLLSEYVKYMLAHGRVLAEDFGLAPLRVTGLAASGRSTV